MNKNQYKRRARKKYFNKTFNLEQKVHFKSSMEEQDINIKISIFKQVHLTFDMKQKAVSFSWEKQIDFFSSKRIKRLYSVQTSMDKNQRYHNP